jgi:hypothetical protein
MLGVQLFANPLLNFKRKEIVMNCEKCSKKGLCPVTFGLSLGLTCALFMAVAAWAAMCCGYGKAMVDLYAPLFYGYDASFVGGLWGALWGFIKGFIFGFVLVAFYRLIKCCCGKSCDCMCKGNMQK